MTLTNMPMSDEEVNECGRIRLREQEELIKLGFRKQSRKAVVRAYRAPGPMCMHVELPEGWEDTILDGTPIPAPPPCHTRR